MPLVRHPSACAVCHPDTGAGCPSFSEIAQQELAALGAVGRRKPDSTGTAHAASTEALVLVVDDEPDMRTYLCSCLRPRWRVVTAPDGREALERMASAHPALVVADVVMPRMDGLALCEALKADPARRHIPVLLISAERSGRGLADAYLPKPFTRRRLIALVERLLSAPPLPPP